MRILIVVLFPFVVFLGVARVMAVASGRETALADSQPPNPTPLNMRRSYDAAAVDQFWAALGAKGRIAERRFLQYDLTFPIVYGGALALSLIWLSRRAGWPPAIAVVPAIGGIADWAENLIQLKLLSAYHANPTVAALDPGTVRIASLATDVKLLGVGAGFVLVVVLGLRLAVRRAGL